MPLKRGKSEKTLRYNIRELMHSWKRKGKIGNVKPKSAAHARRVAVAIAFDVKRKSRRKRR